MQTNMRAFVNWDSNGDLCQYTEDFFVQVVNIGTVAASPAAWNANFVVQADADFEWIMSTWSANVDGQAAQNWSDALVVGLTVQVNDGGSGRILFTAPTPISAIAGSGKQPFILPVPRIFQSKSTVNLNGTNISASQYDNVFLNMIGRKIFKVGLWNGPDVGNGVYPHYLNR